MGGCIGKSKGNGQSQQWADETDESYARRLQQREIQLAQQRGQQHQPLLRPQQQSSQPFQGQGNQLGGGGGHQAQALGGGNTPLSAEERRQRQLAAAEQRQKEHAGRGGVTEKRAQELQEQQIKEELIGKIQAYCAMRKKEEPMGLRLASVQQLKDTLNQLQTRN